MTGRTFLRGKTWWIAYNVRGKEYRESSASKKEADAKRLLKKRQKEIAGDKFVGPIAERATLAELLDGLERDYKLNSRAAIKNLPSYRRHLLAFFGETARAVDINGARVKAYQEARLNAGSKPATVNHETNALSRAFTVAIEDGLLANAPKIGKIREENTRTGFFERAEFEAVRAYLRPDLGDFVTWAYLTGMRRGEIASLTWGDIDEEANCVRLRGSESKNDESRIVPLRGEFAEVVNRRRERRVVKREGRPDVVSPWIFHRGDGLQVKQFDKAWKAATKAAGLEGRVPHDFRRTAIRNMIRAGIPEKVAMLISGHKTRAIFERYNIVDERDLVAAVERVDEYVRALPKKRRVVGLEGQDR